MKKNNKGFTLMEMLIVVAIIAVLVAIAIPTFTSSLNKARVATDEANIRAGYASAMLKILNSDTAIADNTAYTLNTDGSVSTADETGKTAYTTKGNAKKVNATSIDIAGQAVTSWEADKGVTYTYVSGGVGASDTLTIKVG